MLGSLRTLLAVLVAVFHLFTQWGPMGTLPVFAFYVISGYLMTLVMHESYGYAAAGRLAFVRNRVLRLYPGYWAACAFTLVLIALSPGLVQQVHEAMTLPRSPREVVTNLLMLYPAWRPESVTPRLVPPTWALTVELFFYALICLGLSRRLAVVKAWFALSVVYVVWTYVAQRHPGDRYFPVAAAALPFSVGAWVYFLAADGALSRTLLRWGLNARALVWLMLLNVALCSTLAGLRQGAWLIEVGTYLNVALTAAALLRLKAGDRWLNISPRADQTVGDYAYPVYLLHWQAGALVVVAWMGHMPAARSLDGFVLLLASVPVIWLGSWVVIHWVDAPLQRWRAASQVRRTPPA